MHLFVLVVVLSVLVLTDCFQHARGGAPLRFQARDLRMADKIDPNVGYGPVGSLIRQGPVPFFIRVVKPDTYNQAVEKYMRGEK
jgi:hypothetical protein